LINQFKNQGLEFPEKSLKPDAKLEVKNL